MHAVRQQWTRVYCTATLCERTWHCSQKRGPSVARLKPGSEGSVKLRQVRHAVSQLLQVAMSVVWVAGDKSGRTQKSLRMRPLMERHEHLLAGNKHITF
jgi:hypothetical protein